MAMAGSGKSRRPRGARADDTDSPVLITGARKSYEEELRDRKRRYFFLMSLRIPALVLAALALMIWDNGWIALAIVAFSIPIPWIAVLGANDRPRRSKLEPRAYARGSLEDSFTTKQIGPGGVVYTSEGTRTADSAGESAPRALRASGSAGSGGVHGTGDGDGVTIDGDTVHADESPGGAADGNSRDSAASGESESAADGTAGRNAPGDGSARRASGHRTRHFARPHRKAP